MRVWDLHPGYLSRNSLLGQHAEIHALLSVLEGSKKGYRSHPETLRWKGHLDRLKGKHDLTVKEMNLRGYRHASPVYFNLETGGSNVEGKLSYIDHPAEQFEILRAKYREPHASGRIPLPVRGTDFWAHHKYSVMSRSYNFYKEVRDYLKSKNDLYISREKELIEWTLDIMEMPVSHKSLVNVLQHLWGYFKKEASTGEKEKFFYLFQEHLQGAIDFLYYLSHKYKQEYLIHSTVFADFV